MKLKFVAAALAAGAFISPALAADFSGARIEARAGLDSIDLQLNYDDGVDQFEVEGDESDIGYGAEIGYDHGFGKALVGAYVGFDLSSAEFCSEIYGLDEGCLTARRNITVGIRSGYAVAPNALFYVKGGYSNGRLRVSYEDFEDILEDFSESESRDGYHLGVGGEMAFGPNAYAKLEYVYTKYDDFDVDEFTTGEFSRNQVLAGVGFRF